MRVPVQIFYNINIVDDMFSSHFSNLWHVTQNRGIQTTDVKNADRTLPHAIPHLTFFIL